MLGDWVIFFLALLLVPVLLLEETSTDPGVVGAATVANAAIWVLFALDYAVDLWRAPDRGAHVRSHWWDLALLVVSPPLKRGSAWSGSRGVTTKRVTSPLQRRGGRGGRRR